MFGVQTKYGWESGGFQIGNPNGMWEQVTKEAFQAPNDGEMFVSTNLKSTNRHPCGKDIIVEIYQHRHSSMSFMHGYFDEDVNENSIMYKWKNEIITEQWLNEYNIPFAPKWFEDQKGNKVKRNAYEFIRDYLGYKLEADEFTITEESGKLKIKMTLRNYGMSAVFNLKSGFTLFDKSYNIIDTVLAGNPKEWLSRDKNLWKYPNNTPIYKLNASLILPYEKGEYHLGFYLKDCGKSYAVLGNKVKVENGNNIIHTFNI